MLTAEPAAGKQGHRAGSQQEGRRLPGVGSREKARPTELNCSYVLGNENFTKITLLQRELKRIF